MKNPDYNHLYLELGLQPGCGIDELRHAYRRHVAGLHPDRGEQDLLRGDGSLSLSDLNVLYGEAIRFQQRYGRLPGAPQPIHARGAPTSARSTLASAVAHVGGDRSGVAANRGRRLLLALLLVAAVVAGLMLGSPDAPVPVAVHGSADTSATGMSVPPPEPLPTQLALGMDAATVIVIQGEPVGKSDVEWSYGPSWLRFEKGKLSDWYSSQLYPLRTGSSRPPPKPPAESPGG